MMWRIKTYLTEGWTVSSVELYTDEFETIVLQNGEERAMKRSVCMDEAIEWHCRYIQEFEGLT